LPDGIGDVLLKREYFMSVRSWFGFGRSRPTKVKRSLLRNQRASRRLQQIQRDAAADVAAIRGDDKYFDPKSPGNQPPY
jgi:hypothetical protein